jgi:hypothetical protein
MGCSTVCGSWDNIRKLAEDAIGNCASGFAVGQYIVVYRVDDADALILHVIRGGRDVEGLLEDPN